MKNVQGAEKHEEQNEAHAGQPFLAQNDAQHKEQKEEQQRSHQAHQNTVQRDSPGALKAQQRVQESAGGRRIAEAHGQRVAAGEHQIVAQTHQQSDQDIAAHQRIPPAAREHPCPSDERARPESAHQRFQRNVGQPKLDA